MINSAMDILDKHPIRKSKAQKQAFREDVLEYVQSLGYEAAVEKGDFGAKNIVIGDPKTAKYLVGGHYDTPAAMFFPNLMTPCNFMPFFLYQAAVTVGMIFLVVV